LGDGTTNSRTTPVQVLVPNNIIQISAGLSTSLFLSANGTVYAVGDNTVGKSGIAGTIG
jgi:alpha-tubulin suppressor-like RCC1 family protein